MKSKIVVLAFIGWLPVAVTAGPLLYGTAHSGARGASVLYSISPTTGAATSVGAIGFDQVDALAFAPGGRLYGVGQNGAGKWTLLTIDLTTGAGTAVGATGLDVRFQDIAFGFGGSLFGYTKLASQKSKDGMVYSIDPNSGAASLVGNLPSVSDDQAPVALASQYSLYTVNASTLGMVRGAKGASATALHYSPSFGSAPSGAKAVEFDAGSGKLWALMQKGSGDYLTTIDVKTGDVAAVGQTAGGLHSLAVEPQTQIPPPPTPAPSSLLLLCTGILALLGWSRWGRSRRRSGRVKQGAANSA